MTASAKEHGKGLRVEFECIINTKSKIAVTENVQLYVDEQRRGTTTKL